MKANTLINNNNIVKPMLPKLFVQYVNSLPGMYII